MERRYITTPIYYVNDVPHIGHAYTTVAADVDARAARQGLGNDNVYFLTGTDEHGSKIAQAAAEQGVPTQQFVDQNTAAFQAAWKLLNISNNDFIRTTEQRHVTAVQQILRQLHTAKTPDGKEAVYEGEYEGLYCSGCEKFLLPSELVDGLCPDHKKAPEQLKEKNWFFRLSAYLNQIEEKVNSDAIKIVPAKKKAEVLGLIRQLRETKDGGDFSISRESVTWGIDLPSEYGSATQKAYVWVDALTNYITALGYGSSDDNLFKKFWADEKTTVVHYLAQDIIKFHSVYWPAILLALDIFRPLELRIHGYFTIAGQKMSKSLGNVIPPQQLVDRYGVDATRWLLATGFPFGSESDISLAKFDERYTAELANLLGNHASRVTDLIAKFANGELTGTAKLLDVPVLQQLHTDSIYLQEQKPWLLAKQDPDAARVVVNEVGLRLRDSILPVIAPIIPTTAASITTALAARPITKLEPLFPRLAQ
jgi:methionyl-tRNA synthetase